MEEDEEPRSSNPVSLEDYIVYKPSGRTKNKYMEIKEARNKDVKISQTVNKREDLIQKLPMPTAALVQNRPFPRGLRGGHEAVHAVPTYTPNQRVNLSPYPKDMTQMPTIFNSSALRAKRALKVGLLEMP